MADTVGKRQSIRPTAPFIIGALIAAIAMAAVWLAVSAAVGNGGQDCPARDKSSVGKRCR